MAMSLRQLVEFRERLKVALNVSRIVTEIDDLSRNLGCLDKDLDHKYQTVLHRAMDNYAELINEAEYHKVNLETVFEDIQKDINAISTQYFTTNYDVEFEVDQDTEVRKSRKIYLPADVEKVVLQRLDLHLDWKYPGLEIGLHDHVWTERLVALDPLYLVEPNLNLIDESIKQFTPEYQRRVRPYHLRDIDFRTLPQGQMGFVFSWNYLNYKSLDTIKQWLQEVYKVLRPGGVFMFSYNNADIPSGAGFAETFWMSYMPKSTLVPLCEMLGYEVIASYDFNQSACWIELKKPGLLQTVKAHQALGELKPVGSEPEPEPEPITEDQMSTASIEQLERKELYELRRLANELKIDTPDRIRYGYTLEKLRAILKDKKSQ